MQTSVGALTNDIYGKLYFYIQDILTSFRERIQTLDVSFNLFQVDAKSLTEYLSPGDFCTDRGRVVILPMLEGN